MDATMQEADQAAAAAAAPQETTPAPEAAPPAAPPNPDVEAFNQKWASVQADTQDFNTWTALLGIADRLPHDQLAKVRQAYDAFLAEYPLCYGYWKKYADAEIRHGNTDVAAHVYERGVAATPYSADLWAHYAAFRKAQPDASADDVRAIYERGLAYVATDFNAHTLWDKYLAFEQEKGSTHHIAALYSRVLACPVRDLDRYYSSFKSYTHPLAAAQLLQTHEYDAIRVRLEGERAEQRAKAKAEAEAAKKAEEAKVKAEAGEGAEVKAEGEGEEAAPPPPASNGDGAEIKEEIKEEVKEEAKEEAIVITDDDVKQVWVKQYDELYDATKAELAKRKPYEEAARRPYFHVKPLDGVQLYNWIRYLDFIEARGDHTATVTLYERCLVACANYPEFWQRYVRYLSKQGDTAGAKAALERCVGGFCKRRPEAHLYAAHCDEERGDVEAARARFKHLLTSVAPRLLEAVTAAANFERRQGNLDAACHWLSELLQEEKAKDGSRIHPFLAIHYAHFLRRHKADLVAARKVLDDALEACPGVRSLWEAAVHFEELVAGKESVARALDLYDRCTAPPAEGASSRALAERDREELSARSVDFADMYGTLEQVKAASDRHASRFMLPTTVTAEARAAASGKRPADSHAGGAAKAPRSDMGHGHHHAAHVAPMAAAPPPPPMVPAAAAAAGYGYPAAAPAAAAAAAAAYSSYYGYGQYPAAQQYPGYGYSGYGY